MKHEEIKIEMPDGKPLDGLMWGNNAAWICKCGKLLGDRTAQKKARTINPVRCRNDNCRLLYGIVPRMNSKGYYNGSAVESVCFIDEQTQNGVAKAKK